MVILAVLYTGGADAEREHQKPSGKLLASDIALVLAEVVYYLFGLLAGTAEPQTGDHAVDHLVGYVYAEPV